MRDGSALRYLHNFGRDHPPMFEQHGRKRPCARCGRPSLSKAKDRAPICNDCREADPEYVRAVSATGRGLLA